VKFEAYTPSTELEDFLDEIAAGFQEFESKLPQAIPSQPEECDDIKETKQTFAL
jgi:hypothetical protein